MNINCTANNQCENSIIRCQNDEDCYLTCFGQNYVCQMTTVICPLSAECHIRCQGPFACHDLQINAALSTGTLSLSCDAENEDTNSNHGVCGGIKVYGSKMKWRRTNLTVSCRGGSNSCINAEIECPSSGHCSIDCDGTSSCESAVVRGPTDGDHLHVRCGNERSCTNATFDGRETRELQIFGCTEYESCSNMTVYCPSNLDGQKLCIIQGL